MKHPSLEYLLVACVAAIVTYLLTPLARRVAIRWRAVAKPRNRDVHAVATPRMGGVALFGGFALALFVASRLPTLHESFQSGTVVMMWVVIAAAVICAVGVLDDRYELDSLTKLAGQVLATGLMVTLGGVQIAEVGVPWSDTTLVLGRDLGVPVTILFTVLTINALNFVDGLDGLAAGITAIAAGGFFVYSYHLGRAGFADIVSPATLLAAVLAGACLGFLPHNFFPARIFMGDSGSMVLGLLLSAASTTATTSTDPQVYRDGLSSLPIFLPELVLVAVLALPFIDLLLAVVRRVSRGRSPFAPDKRHLHHRLLEMGHTHRRAVLLMYFWSGLVAFGGVGVSISDSGWLVVSVLVVLAASAVLALAVPALRRRRIQRTRRRVARAMDAESARPGSVHAQGPR
ncbi:glycosyltransferase family 4 protein [uncultured Jatrophihabitans sp.]|uniref:glycosyltransferase family 4 protein n=1 Tax=uncultured Jatrophihabitans sp. TaxID=1610747 RepID=UPI0035CB1EB0